MSKGWHILREGDRLTLARRLPVRLDICVQTRVPLVRLTPLAHQIRQDVWRLLQGVRGFSPVVVLDREADHVLVSTGGRIDTGAPTGLYDTRLAQLVADPATRKRWIRWAT